MRPTYTLPAADLSPSTRTPATRPPLVYLVLTRIKENLWHVWLQQPSYNIRKSVTQILACAVLVTTNNCFLFLLFVKLCSAVQWVAVVRQKERLQKDFSWSLLLPLKRNCQLYEAFSKAGQFIFWHLCNVILLISNHYDCQQTNVKHVIWLKSLALKKKKIVFF